MSSYTSSFKALAAALLMIVAAEVGYSAVDGSPAVERAGYLNWNFNEPELIHKVLIDQKLRSAVAARPDVIQVGDSSGFHAIVPKIVEQFIPGLTYANLSCCANTGFDGYYTLADFMFRHDPALKAVVLYVAWNNTVAHPDALEANIVGSPDRLRSAFGPIAAFTSPPTMAAREAALRPIYTLDGALSPLGSVPHDRRWPAMLGSIRDHQGWMVEPDKHRLPAVHEKWNNWLCHNRVGVLPPTAAEVHDILGRPQSYFKVEVLRLASLTARHNAKLVVMFQPHPCEVAAETPILQARRAELAEVVAAYPNVVAPGAVVPFEHWPSQLFTSADHLRTGNEDAASRRLGRVLAAALGLPVIEPPPAPPPPAPTPVWSTADFASPPWWHDEVRSQLQADGRGTIVTETTTAGWHRLERVLPDLAAGTYAFSATYSSAADRQVSLYMREAKVAADQALVHCDTRDGSAAGGGKALDWTIEELPDQRYRCTGKVTLVEKGAVLGVIVSPTNVQGPYKGDGSGNVVLYDVQVSSIDQR